MEVSNVRERDEDWIVTIIVEESKIISDLSVADDIREARARAKAMIEVGVASRDLLLTPDLALEVPRIERKTELINKTEVEDGIWEYEVRVHKGAVI